jgi:predicted small lipoprotein YifL
MAGKFIISCVVLALLAGLAAGCGNKGDLVLPDADGAQAQAPRSTAPAQGDPS